ncbi:MAG: hypothetical protein GY944_06110 [bacterium]|nr:hypothetical protein [bacterium]
MVVECRKCGTRFQLDAARIPEAGIRVRCSRCKHAFFLQHPGQSEAGAVDAVVQEAVQHEAAPPPGATQDLPVSNAANAADAQSAAADFDVEDEDDWEFNEDLPSYDDDPEDRPEDGLDPEGFDAEALGRDPGESMSIDLAGEDGFDDSLDVGEPGGLDPSEMTADDLQSSSMSIDGAPPREVETAVAEPGPAAPLEAPAESASTVEGVREAAFGSVDDFSSLGEPDEHQEPASDGSQEEALEDPESWDFFGDGDGDVGGPPAGGAPADSFQEAASPRAGSVADAAGFEESTAQEDWPTLDGGGPISATARIFSALGWVAVCGLIVAGVFPALVDSFDPGVRAPVFVSIGDMRAANVRGQWLETASAGTVYVVSGDLLNPGTRAAAPQLALEVSLLDERGSDLDLPTALAGRDIAFDDLRELPAAGLAAFEQRAAGALVWGEIAPGQSARFAAVFVGLPDQATHFQLRGVDPSGVGVLDDPLIDTPQAVLPAEKLAESVQPDEPA